VTDVPVELLEKAATVLGRLGRILNDGEGTSASKFLFVKHADDVQMRVHLYTRFNGTVVMRIDACVGSARPDMDLYKRLWALTEWMPFCSVRFEDRNDNTVTAWLTHSVLFEGVRSAGEVEQAIGSISHVWGPATGILSEVSAAQRKVDKEPPAEAPPRPDDPIDEDDENEDDENEDDEEDAMTTMSLNNSRRPVTIPARPMTTAAVLAELDKLVGLAPVKDVTKSLVARRRLEKMRENAGMKAVLPSPHLVFTGNPGTGKTTVARLIGQLYKSLGLLSSGHLIEANRSTLVAAYVGQTALKTRQVCEQAKGGVLFIDEAYSLAGEHGYDYGREAVEELLTFMENNRGKIAVVVAGYPDEMGKFMNMNPGLKSRFDVTINFPDYSNDELLEIFNVVAREHDYEPARIQAAVARIVSLTPRGQGFGNAREMRKLFGEILDVHARRVGRLARPGSRHLRELAPNDCLPILRRLRDAWGAPDPTSAVVMDGRAMAGYL